MKLEDWNLFNIEDLGQIVSGGTPKTNVSHYWDGDINWITPTDVTAAKGKKFINSTTRKITIEGLNNSSANLLPVGTLIICTRATIGDSVINEVPISTNQGFKSLIPNDKVLSEYLYYWVIYNKELLIKNSSGSTFLELSTKSFKNLEVLLPPLPEQQKIAEILSTVDAKIEIIDQQISETSELKKGLMQQLLSGKLSVVKNRLLSEAEMKDSVLGRIPESWEVVKFSELISSHCYGPRFSSKDYSEIGNVKTIRGTDINQTGDILYEQVPIAQLPFEFVENHKLKNGDLVMITTADCGLTGVFINQGFPFIPSAYAVRITLNEKAFPLYFKYVFQTAIAKNQVERFIRKGTVANLPGSDILKFIFPYPKVSEQKKIADILTSVDDKLQVLSEKKVTYQELKQGLMQQLLTGKVRVKV